MEFRNFFKNKLFSVNRNEFDAAALELFRYQAGNNPVYARYISAIGCEAGSIETPAEIPFMPVELFKSFPVITGSMKPELIFSSSSTTGGGISKHYVGDPALYEAAFEKNFRQFYGSPGDYTILALLPSYLERQGSSLVYMMQRLSDMSGYPESGFYLYDYENLASVLRDLHRARRKCLLFGVTFALLEFAGRYQFREMNQLTVMETGGMKGRGKELVREEVHGLLKAKLGVNNIHSEYGMTELLSQAYSKGDGLFKPPPWMKVFTRDTLDPFLVTQQPSKGALNIIDLANIDSCAFIATSDLGGIEADGSFTVSGRYDHSDVRGCNLMVA